MKSKMFENIRHFNINFKLNVFISKVVCGIGIRNLFKMNFLLFSITLITLSQALCWKRYLLQKSSYLEKFKIIPCLIFFFGFRVLKNVVWNISTKETEKKNMVDFNHGMLLLLCILFILHRINLFMHVLT